MEKIYKAIKELKEEEEEEDRQSHGNENMHDPCDLWSPRTREQIERDMSDMAREAEKYEEQTLAKT